MPERTPAQPTAYAATIHLPGFLPTAEPAYFPTAAEAWHHLWSEHADACSDAGETISLDAASEFANAHHRHMLGSLALPTPGYTGNHDQGVAYSVEQVPGLVCPVCGELCPDADALNDHGLARHLEANTL